MIVCFSHIYSCYFIRNLYAYRAVAILEALPQE